MFERFKAYKKLEKSDKFLKGCKTIAELTGDEKMLKEVNEALYLNERLKKEMWYKRKMAISYNLNLIKNGF
jgi:hypothetical protein